MSAELIWCPLHTTVCTVYVTGIKIHFALVRRFASLRSFSSEIRFASELSAEKLPFSASIVGVVVKIGAVLPTTLQHATTACPVSTHQLQSDSVCEV